MRRARGALFAIALGAALGPLDTAVNAAFPAITLAFALPLAEIHWVVVCYMLTYASLLLVCGRWADLYGHKKVFIIGLVWSAASLLLCAIASDFFWFLAFRFMQGIGSALILAVAPALLTLAYPKQKRRRAVALYGLVFSCAFAAGPMVGGFLTEYWGWSSVFWFRVPLAILAIATGIYAIDDGAKQPSSGGHVRFDALTGIALVALVAFSLLSFNQFNVAGGHLLSIAFLLLGLVFGVILIRREGRSKHPLIAPALLRRPLFWVANLSHIGCQLAGFSVFVLCPYYLTLVLAADMGGAGMLLALSPLGMIFGSALAGALGQRLSAGQICSWAAALLGAGLLGIGFWPLQPSYARIALFLLLHGIGLGLFQVGNMDFVMASLARQAQGVAGSLVMLMRTIGVVAGASSSANLFAYLQSTSPVHGQDSAFLYAFQLTFQAAAGLVLAICLVLFFSTAGRRT